MRIKTFEAPTMHEALCLVKGEFGEEAVVLNTKHIKTGGLLGLGGAGKVEIMAAIDDSEVQPRVSIPAASTAVAEKYPIVENIPTPAMAPIAARVYAEASTNSLDTESELNQLRSELKELSSIVKSLLLAPMATTSNPIQLDKPLLLRLGISEDLAHGALSDCLALDDSIALASALAAKMQAFTVPPVLDGHQVIALVGPTGVGKTTTLAKLAAKFSLEQGKKVALVTADTYRIGAVEQLRTYARIMGIPLEIALTPEEVAAGVEKHTDKDIVLIDTVGRSQQSEDHLAELKSFIDAAHPTQTHLVVAASLAQDVQSEVVEKFTALSPTHLVVTKLDESRNRGCLINLPIKTGLGISCLTAGQNVPQDLDFAEAGRIARLVTEVA